ncbi:MAG: DUF3575 domain-containing protein [Alistipes sp.]|nr:DUF3575 domain-containing protein [Alistipes sp.]
MKRLALLFAILICGIATSSAQKVAIKTNALYDATATINLGAEFGLHPRWTLDISGNFNSWSKNKGGGKWKHWLAQPEARYWFCDRFAGHFIGAHLLVGAFNFGSLKNNIKFLGTDLSQLSNYRYQGYGYGAGLCYGYAFLLGKHWNLELELGVGYILADYDKFECDNCGRNIGGGRHHYFGPTKAAINIVYLF